MGIGYEFLQATTEERIIMILILVVSFIIAGILALVEKRKNKKK